MHIVLNNGYFSGATVGNEVMQGFSKYIQYMNVQ